MAVMDPPDTFKLNLRSYQKQALWLVYSHDFTSAFANNKLQLDAFARDGLTISA